MSFIRSFIVLTFALIAYTSIHTAGASEEKEPLGLDAQLTLYQKAFASYQEMHKEGKFNINTTPMQELAPILERGMNYANSIVNSEQKRRFVEISTYSKTLIDDGLLTLFNFYKIHFLLADVIDKSKSMVSTIPSEFRPLLESLGLTSVLQNTAAVFSSDFTKTLEAFDKSKVAKRLKSSKFPFIAVLYCPSGQIPIKTFCNAYETSAGTINLAAFSLKPCNVHGGILRGALFFLLHDFLHTFGLDEAFSEPASFTTLQSGLNAIRSKDKPKLAEGFQFYIPHEVDLQELKVDDNPGKFLLNIYTTTKIYIESHTDLNSLFKTALKDQSYRLGLSLEKKLGKGFSIRKGGDITESSSSSHLYYLNHPIYVPNQTQTDPYFLTMTATVSEDLQEGNHKVHFRISKEEIDNLTKPQANWIKTLDDDVRGRKERIEFEKKFHKENLERSTAYNAELSQRIVDIEKNIRTTEGEIRKIESELDPTMPEPEYLSIMRENLRSNQKHLKDMEGYYENNIKQQEASLTQHKENIEKLTEYLEEAQARLEREQKKLADISRAVENLPLEFEILTPGYEHLSRFYIDDFKKLLQFIDPSLKDKLRGSNKDISEAALGLLEQFKEMALAQ